jgi:hypothetical protein
MLLLQHRTTSRSGVADDVTVLRAQAKIHSLLISGFAASPNGGRKAGAGAPVSSSG